jgi:hypothetical protein
VLGAQVQSDPSQDPAAQLYERGIKTLVKGNADAGLMELKTLIATYPESPYAKLAQEALDFPLLRKLDFHGFKPVATKDILAQFKERGVGLAVEKPYHPESLDRATKVLQELLAQKGVRARVKSQTKQRPPHGIEITFYALKD